MGVLFLVGPRGSGKSLAADILAARYGCLCVDTDVLISEKSGKSAAEIVAEEGWPSFRKHERIALEDAYARVSPACGGAGVVATGGGVVLDAANRAFMREKGLVAYLAVSPERVIERLSCARGASGRPPLSDLPFEDEIRAVMKEREPLYRETAHHCIDAALPAEEVARALYEIIIQGGK